MQPAVDMWSSPTTVYAGGLRQLSAALDGHVMLLVADERLEAQTEAVRASAPASAVVRISSDGAADDTAAAVRDAMARHPQARPVALGGGSSMDVVRLAALAAADPAARELGQATDGVTFWPTRTVNPTVCIPSTIGTASEVSPVVVRTTSAGTAMIVSPGLRASAAILDARVTGTLPRTALGAGLVEPWARTCVPAVAGERLPVQDGIARGLAATLLTLGGDLARTGPAELPDAAWRSAAALASVQTHLSLLPLGRAPAGHLLWPLATEVMRATRLSKAGALAALVPAWLRCLASGAVGRAWGSGDRVREILQLDPAEAAPRLEAWLTILSLPTLLPAIDVEAIVSRVADPWQASGLFLPGVPRAEIAAVLGSASGSEPEPTTR